MQGKLVSIFVVPPLKRNTEPVDTVLEDNKVCTPVVSAKRISPVELEANVPE